MQGVVAKLVQEHRVGATYWACLRAANDVITKQLNEEAGGGAGDYPSPGIVGGMAREVCDALYVFLDRCHHYKEEVILRGAMVAAGVDPTSPALGFLLPEHGEARSLVSNITQNAMALEKAGTATWTSCKTICEAIIQASTAYLSLMGPHVRKEEQQMFPEAIKRITDPGLVKQVIEQCNKVEADIIGTNGFTAYSQKAYSILCNLNPLKYPKK
ncbi:hypothetical protein Pelo_12871 [Pelomyxa schiedti]|nr:hypothetical protein Pelo_12871 [Pelomyxa schiedti]